MLMLLTRYNSQVALLEWTSSHLRNADACRFPVHVAIAASTTERNANGIVSKFKLYQKHHRRCVAGPTHPGQRRGPCRTRLGQCCRSNDERKTAIQ